MHPSMTMSCWHDLGPLSSLVFRWNHSKLCTSAWMLLASCIEEGAFLKHSTYFCKIKIILHFLLPPEFQLQY